MNLDKCTNEELQKIVKQCKEIIDNRENVIEDFIKNPVEVCGNDWLELVDMAKQASSVSSLEIPAIIKLGVIFEEDYIEADVYINKKNIGYVETTSDKIPGIKEAQKNWVAIDKKLKQQAKKLAKKFNINEGTIYDLVWDYV